MILKKNSPNLDKLNKSILKRKKEVQTHSPLSSIKRLRMLKVL